MRRMEIDFTCPLLCWGIKFRDKIRYRRPSPWDDCEDSMGHCINWIAYSQLKNNIYISLSSSLCRQKFKDLNCRVSKFLQECLINLNFLHVYCWFGPGPWHDTINPNCDDSVNQVFSHGRMSLPIPYWSANWIFWRWALSQLQRRLVGQQVTFQSKPKSLVIWQIAIQYRPC